MGSQIKGFVKGLEGGAQAAVVGGFAGGAVEVEGDDEAVRRVAEAGGGLRAAVAEGVGGGEGSELVRDGRAVLGGVEDEAEAPIDGLAEGGVGHTDALPGGEGADGLFAEEAGAVDRAPPAEHFVETGEIVHRSAAGGGGARAGEGQGRIKIERGHRAGGFVGSVVQPADA